VAGEITLRVHSACAWVDRSELGNYDLAAANIPIAERLKENSDAARSSMGSDSRAD
jgi:hypothetical protein